MESGQPKITETEAERIGIAYAVKLSYAAIDKSALPFTKKRNLLFSVYSFRCLFDNADMTYIHPVLIKYQCTFSCGLREHPFYSRHKTEFEEIAREKTLYVPYGGLYVRENDAYTIRFDAGSPVWEEFLRQGKLSAPGDTVPDKFDLYEMVYEILNLDSATLELKAMWYVTFPCIMLLGAPHDPELYEIIKESISGEKVFETVLNSRYGIYIKDSIEELWASEIPAILADWYMPYIEWKNGINEKGFTREVARFQKWLAAGRFGDVFQGTEKLLDTFPDDDDLLLCNIAARVSLGSGDEAFLKETLALTDSALERGSPKKAFFTYYAGLAWLGLKEPEVALEKFRECAALNPKFEPALLMIKAIEEKL